MPDDGTLVVGLTGGIGSGKSTVARLLGEHGAEVIDADQIARELVRPGSRALAAIGQRFGDRFIDEHGALRRKELGALVFADETALAALNALMHPAIVAVIESRLLSAAAGRIPVALIDAALLVELDLHRRCDQVIAVRADEERRIVRIAARDGLSAASVRARMAAQISDRQRVAVADHVIDNDGDLAELERAVATLWGRLEGGDGRSRA